MLKPSSIYVGYEVIIIIIIIILCLKNYTLHNDICKGEASLGIILRCFIHFSDDMPDD